MSVNIELILLALSALFFFSILAGKASSRFGVPALLLFLSVGMLSGSDGLGIQFHNIQIAYAISTIALCIILFSGGMDTRIEEIRPVIAQGVILATLGVFLTALITGVLIWWILGMTRVATGISLLTSLLLAATMSSTDSASVFSILRSRNLHLKNNLRPMLELESGSNDPMAYLLVITIVSLIQQTTTINYWATAGLLVAQLAIGGIAGYLLGTLAVIIINRIHIGNNSLYPILVFTFCILIFSITYFAKGNGYLAVYIAGLVIGNSKFIHKRSALHFFDGLAWLSQLLMFLTLGLLVNPRELIPIIIPGLIISVLMIFISRPVSVILCLLPFKKMGVKDKTYISWVGLRGAVPIIFAIIPLAENVPYARPIFNIVFFCTLVSLLVQGTSLASVARWLGLVEKPEEPGPDVATDDHTEEEIKRISSEIEITQDTIREGNRLIDLPLPEKTLVVMIKRDGKYFVPTGATFLQENDRLVVLTNDDQDLKKTLAGLKIKNNH
ncbi:MAG: potassium/proton antiporter [Chitinophagaceae bacterium]|nr:potassium/proton antiporter [Chitinophagaceae bacterium]